MAEQKTNTTYYGTYFPTRLYGVQDMNLVLDNIVTDGVIVPYVTNVIINFDIRVSLGISKALGIRARITASETVDFTVDTPDATLDRIDSIFYRVDLLTEKRDSIVYRPGIAAGSPVAPDPDTSNPTFIKEIRLCNINVGAGVVNIIAGNIDETVQELSSLNFLTEQAKIDFITATEAIDLDKVAEGKEIFTAGVAASTALTKPTANIALSESMDNGDKLELELQVGSATMKIYRTITLSTNGNEITIPIQDLWGSPTELFSYKLTIHRDTPTTMTAYYGGYVKTILGTSPAITWNPLGTMNINKIRLIKN